MGTGGGKQRVRRIWVIDCIRKKPGEPVPVTLSMLRTVPCRVGGGGVPGVRGGGGTCVWYGVTVVRVRVVPVPTVPLLYTVATTVPL